MKCTNYRKLIYLFDELNDDEKQSIQQHIMSCQVCQQLAQQVKQERMIFKNIYTPPTIDHAQLTDSIMVAIGKREPSSVSFIDQILQSLQLTWMRYSMAMLSFFMITFFILEFFQAPASKPEIQTYPASAKKVALNTALLKELRQTPKSERSSAAEFLSSYVCSQICQTSTRSNCLACKNKYSKLKLHENI